MYDFSQTKLFVLVNLLTEEESSQLEDFILSPVYLQEKFLKSSASRREMLRQYQCFRLSALAIRDGAPEITGDKEQIWITLFPGKPFNDAKWRKSLSRMGLIIKEYLAYKKFSEDRLFKGINLIKSLTQGGEFELSLKEMKRIRSEYDATRQETEITEELLINHYFLAIEELNISLKNGNRLNLDQLNSVEIYLDNFFKLSKLKILCEKANYQNFTQQVSQKVDLSFLERILDGPLEEQIPLVRSYALLFKLLIAPADRASFPVIRKLLTKIQTEPISEEDQWNTFNYCLNVWIKRINLGETDYFASLFLLYQQELHSGFLFRNGLLPGGHFKNIVSTGIKTIEHNLQVCTLEWLESFIEEYQGKIESPPDKKEALVRFALICIAFCKEEYAACIRMIDRDISVVDVYMNADLRIIRLKALLEQALLNSFAEGEDRLIFAGIDSFNAFLRRNKVLQQARIDVYLTRLKYIKQLLYLILGNGDQESLEDFISSVENIKHLPEKTWIKEKLGGIAP